MKLFIVIVSLLQTWLIFMIVTGIHQMMKNQVKLGKMIIRKRDIEYNVSRDLN